MLSDATQTGPYLQQIALITTGQTDFDQRVQQGLEPGFAPCIAEDQSCLRQAGLKYQVPCDQEIRIYPSAKILVNAITGGKHGLNGACWH